VREKMKRKLLWLLVGLLVGSGVAAATLVQAGGNEGKQTVQQREADDAGENEASEVDDADEPGDHDAAGDVEDTDEKGDHDAAGDVEDSDQAGDDAAGGAEDD
jgi:hypothetical protein